MQVTSLLQRLAKTLAAESDLKLLERFLADRDPAAFRIIVARHGPMVYRICRRLLHSDADAEDAFQATFLVLLRQAGAIRKRTSLASWLHGVARKASLRLRTTTNRRHQREALACRAEAIPADEVGSGEVREIFDEELTRMPDRLRSPLVLCYLEGLSQDEAAAHLGMARRTFQRHLESGRTLLGIRLTQRGITLSTTLLAGLVSECTAAMPGSLADNTTALATMVQGGKDLASHSPILNTLTHEVIRHMFTKRPNWKWLAVALVVIGLGTAVIGPALVEGQPPLKKAPDSANPIKGPEAPDERAKPAEAIAWGKAADGLKVGIGYRCADERSSRVGCSATLVVYLRNESQAPITMTHIENLFEEFTPKVRDARGNSVRVYSGPANLGLVNVITRTVNPAETIRLSYAWFLVRGADWNGKVEAPTFRAKPGRYTVACEHIPLRLAGRDKDEMNWSTGWLELTVDDESAPARATRSNKFEEQLAEAAARSKDALAKARELSVAEAKAVLAEATALLQAAEGHVAFCKSQTSRMQELFKEKAVDQQVLIESEDKLRAAVAAKDAAAAKVNLAKIQVAKAELDVSQIVPPKLTPSVPANVTPSNVTPSTVTPSFVTPSTVTPSFVTPSTATPSKVTPSNVTPSFVTPSTATPSKVTPSNGASKLQAEIEVAKASVQLAQAEYDHRKHVAERYRLLAAKSAIDPSLLQEAEDQLKIAGASVELAKAKLNALQSK